MQRNLRSPKERIARALCRLDGHAAGTVMDGVPMWHSYDDEAVVVLAAIEVSPLLELLKEIELNEAVPRELRDKAHLAAARFVGLA
jgi:hypothetical protein